MFVEKRRSPRNFLLGNLQKVLTMLCTVKYLCKSRLQNKVKKKIVVFERYTDCRVWQRNNKKVWYKNIDTYV